MFEREKLSGNNFNDWFRQLKLVLRVKKKMYVIEQPLTAAPATDSEANVLAEWNALYDAYNEKSNKKSHKAKGKGKANGKGKDKPVYIPKPKNPKPAAKEHPSKDDTCHHCKEVGHWKRNCPIYFVELLKKKMQVGSASSSGKMTRKSFLHRSEKDYALESVTRILNMVLTKKVDKSPYELGYGKVPNLYYLKVEVVRRL
nr:zinc finger, CCHC-type [Tanacetum cinerariifolium]